MKDSNLGQSLFEVVLALSIMALIILGVVILATVSIKNSDFSRDKTLAARYSQEALEWLRGERDENWEVFFAKGSTGGSEWCLNVLSWPATQGDCSTTLAGLFERKAFLTQRIISGQDEIEAKVTVSWTDSGGFHEVSSVTSFTNYKAK